MKPNKKTNLLQKNINNKKNRFFYAANATDLKICLKNLFLPSILKNLMILLHNSKSRNIRMRMSSDTSENFASSRMQIISADTMEWD